MDITVKGLVMDSIQNAQVNADSTETEIRLTRRGSVFVENLFNGLAALAGEGTYFIAQTATPGTGITSSVATGTTFSDTQAILSIYNRETQTTGGNPGKRIILDFISILYTAAGTASTSVHVAHRIDSGSRASGGTSLTPVNCNMDVGSASLATVLFGNPTITAASGSVRNVGRNVLRAQIPVIGDLITIKFGSQEQAAGGVSIAAATASAITVFNPPVILGPNQTYVLNEWSPARSAAQSAECIVGWIER